MNKPKAVVVTESFTPGSLVSDMIMCIGTFDTMKEAYGRAVMFLSDLAENTYEAESSTEQCSITPLQRLEGDTGFGLFLKNKDGKTLDGAFVLFANDDED